MSGQEILDGYFLVLTRKAGEQLAAILGKPALNRTRGGERVLRSVLCRFLNLGAVVRDRKKSSHWYVTVGCVVDEPPAFVEVVIQLTADSVRRVEGLPEVKKKLAFVLDFLSHELTAA